MPFETLWLLYLRELRSTLRERNVLLYVIVVPLLLYPFLLWLAMSAASVMTAEEERSPVRIVITPPEPSLNRALSTQRITVVQSPNPEADLRNGVIDALVKVDNHREVHLIYDGRYRQSQRAQQRLRSLISRYRDVRLEEIALEGGVKLSELHPLYVDSRDEGSSGELGRYVLGTFLPLTLLVVLSLGGLYPAVETMAGEHERQTLDTTMGLSVARWQIVVSKYFLVVTLCTLSGFCNLFAVTVSLRSILQPLSANLADHISWGWSLYTMAVILTGIVAMSMLVAAATLLFTAHAKSFRQGQAATTPLFMSILIPAGALVDRSLTLDNHTCWLPVINVALLWRDSLINKVTPNLALATVAFSLCWVLLALILLTQRLQRQGRALGLLDGMGKTKQ
jgi:ABC-type Na+ efflux pump permease subunit